MKRIIIFLSILLGIGCKGGDGKSPEPVKGEHVFSGQVVVYDTLESQATKYRVKYNIPPDYELIYDSTAKEYYVRYIFGNVDMTAYLQYYPDLGVTTICLTLPYATKFKKPSEAVVAIMKHHVDVVADHKNKKP